MREQCEYGNGVGGIASADELVVALRARDRVSNDELASEGDAARFELCSRRQFEPIEDELSGHETHLFQGILITRECRLADVEPFGARENDDRHLGRNEKPEALGGFHDAQRDMRASAHDGSRPAVLVNVENSPKRSRSPLLTS